MDELFTRYMYFERAKQGIKSSTTEALRKFYEKDDYAILKKEQTLDNLLALAEFWNDIANQDEERFSKKILRKLFILNYVPNGMWNYFVSVYFMQNKDYENQLDEEKFYNFIDTIIPFIYAFKIKDIDAYNQCLNRQTKKLEEALYYLNDYFNKKGHGRWLLEFVEINEQNEEITDEEIITEISNTFNKVLNSGGIDKLFLRAIRVSL